ERAQPNSIRLNRTACIGIGQRAKIPSGAAFTVTVLPEIGELGFLSANAEDRGSGTKPAPASTSQTPQLCERSVQALAHDFAAAQPDLVDAMRRFRITAIAHVVDEKHPHLRQR